MQEALDQLKADIAEMLAEQTDTLLSQIETAKREPKHDIMDVRGSLLEEISRRIDRHIAAQH